MLSLPCVTAAPFCWPWLAVKRPDVFALVLGMRFAAGGRGITSSATFTAAPDVLYCQLLGWWKPAAPYPLTTALLLWPCAKVALATSSDEENPYGSDSCRRNTNCPACVTTGKYGSPIAVGSGFEWLSWRAVSMSPKSSSTVSLICRHRSVFLSQYRGLGSSISENFDSSSGKSGQSQWSYCMFIFNEI